MLQAKLLFLIIVANGTPIIVYRIFGGRWSAPVDFGGRFLDGEPIFGPSKTIRGIVSSVLVTSVIGAMVSFTWIDGLLIGVAAMAGDLFSSFVKRRLALKPSSMAVGFDHLPESLFPMLVASYLFAQIGWASVILVVGLFVVLSLILSRILYHFNVRKVPY